MSARSFVLSPRPYLAWALFVCFSLVATGLVEPYLFGFATMALAGGSCAVGLLGLGVVLFSRTAAREARLRILSALLVTAAAVGGALTALASFGWA